MSATTLRLVLTVFADLLAVAGGVALYLQTGQILWVVVGGVLSAMIVVLVLVPAIRAAKAEKASAAGTRGAPLVE